MTIMLAQVLVGERLTSVRLAGLSLAAACVALIAAGGPGGNCLHFSCGSS